MRALLLVLLLATPAAAQDFSFGSKPDETLEASAILYVPEIKGHSHYGFGETGSRAGETSFRDDLGYTPNPITLGLQAAVNFGEFGWIGGDVLGFDVVGASGVLGRERMMEGTTLNPGDFVQSDGLVVWGGLHYGYELRVKLFDFLDLAASPTFGFGFFDLRADLQRLAPTVTPVLAGNASAFVLTPGARLLVEAWDLVRVGCDLETGLTGSALAISEPYTNLWERIRVYAGVNVFGVDATIGWRLFATHVAGSGDGVDLRLRGLDASLGVRF
jgi:hypothetical protein